MNKSPEEYFQAQNFFADVPPGAEPGEFTEAECAFVEKYMGVDAASTLKSLGLEEPGDAPPEEGRSAVAVEMPREEALDDVLRRASELLMVGFFLGQQEFVVPTLAVQEVIRHSAPARLPGSPAFVAGVINLRGKVTPLIRLRDMLGLPDDEKNSHRFIIICRRQGLQMGLMIDRVHTMYRVPQANIDWSIEACLGASVDFISGLVKLHEGLVGIVSVDRIVEEVLRR